MSSPRQLRAITHHITGHLVGGTIWVPAKPVKYQGWLGWWHQRRREAQCARTVGHCWHLEHNSLIDWYCCCCGGGVDGCPPVQCQPCVDLQLIDAGHIS